MAFYDDLIEATKADREAFQSIPLIAHVVKNGASPELYLDFLTQAYHHVKHTCPLLETAKKLCGPDDKLLKDALEEYIDEEIGHDEWILDDIEHLGGDRDAVRNGDARLPCRVMVSHAYYGIEHDTPYCLLGMVHVLEGMSVSLAHHARDSIMKSFGLDKVGAEDSPKGYTYLSTHGALDVSHVDFYAGLANQVTDEKIQQVIVRGAKDFYKLYGDIFRDLGDRHL